MSLFPEVDEEIEGIKAKEALQLQDLIDKSEMYRPSNSDSGNIFYANFCNNCTRGRGDSSIHSV